MISIAVLTLNYFNLLNRYIADENGFQPIGDSIPTPPPVPQDILASLQGQGQPGLNQLQQGFSQPPPNYSTTPQGFNQFG